ncbi:MAG TPA: hypothetical protein VNM70_12650, partial [Burkholderiales bacterium]|nr:hypothetical protein [Burkholderiales bacterium]
MQPFVKTLLLAAGLALASYAPLSSAADADAGAPPAAQQTSSDTAAEASEATEAPGESSPAAPLAVTPPATIPPAPFAPTLMDLTLRPTSLWQRIRNGFGLPDMSSPLVREQE